MSDLRELYQSVILDHNKHPRNFGALDGATHKADGHNPLCGDKINLQLIVEDGVVTDVAFEGEGCAISTASASVMTETLKGRTLRDVEALFGRFHDLVTGKGGGDLDELGKLAVFAGVSEFPIRVKCATLSWHTLRAALEGAGAPATTE
ncbi:MAG: SUF system NifU family Fe-S cluster assembly protein [Planctomycetota bacterium]|nr:SUF system NifU family Fe-S cluster assembly protein [Planctomycetota bacterium]